MRLPRNARVFRGQLDAAPFICVFFILLMFVLLHTSLVSHPGIKIQLPEASGLPGPAGPHLVVAIDSNGAMYFENRAIQREDFESRLSDRLARLGEPATLVVQADQSVPQKTLVALAEMARRAGIREAVLATRPVSLPDPRTNRQIE